MADEKIAMPGDPDESVDKLKKGRREATEKKAEAAEAKAPASEKTEEKKALADNVTGADQVRGDQSPVQYDGDGWGETPAQMRP